MRKIVSHLICFGAAFNAAAAAEPLGSARDAYVPSRRIVLTINAEQADSVRHAAVWASTDDRRTWFELPAAILSRTAVSVTVANDGRYDFYLVLENEVGASGPAPARGAAPHASVVVDTTPPTLHAQASPCEYLGSDERRLPLRCTLIEEHLRDHAVRLFYRSGGDATWADGGALGLQHGEAFWTPPPQASGPIQIRLVATDLAGNRASHDLSAVLPDEPTLPGAPRATPMTDATARSASTQPALPADGPAAPRRDDATPPTPPSNDGQLPEPLTPRAQRLAEAAAAFSRRGEFSLAAARLREALALAPRNPDLLVSLGNASFQTRDLAEAERLFRLALDSQPGHAAALEGLALVAMNLDRYPDARENLRRLLELDPSTARHWLHYGDVEHRLGQQQSALEAWRHVLQLAPEPELRGRAERRLRLFGPESSTRH